MADLLIKLLGDATGAEDAFTSVEGAVRKAQSVIIDFTKQSVKAYMESERVQRQLQLVAKDLTGAFSAQATAMAQANNISDELVQQMQTLLLRYGEAPAAVKGTTQAVLDYAAATGTDARTATELLTRGVESGTGHFKGLGISIAATGDRTRDLAAATAELAKKYGGAGAADAESLTGQVRGLEEAFGDVQEAFGGFIAEMANKTGVIGMVTAQLRELTALMGQLAAMDPRQALSVLGQRIGNNPIATALTGGTSSLFGALAAGGEETQSGANTALVAQRIKQQALARASMSALGFMKGGRVSGGGGGGGGGGDNRHNAAGAAGSAGSNGGTGGNSSIVGDIINQTFTGGSNGSGGAGGTAGVNGTGGGGAGGGQSGTSGSDTSGAIGGPFSYIRYGKKGITGSSSCSASPSSGSTVQGGGGGGGADGGNAYGVYKSFPIKTNSVYTITIGAGGAGGAGGGESVGGAGTGGRGGRGGDGGGGFISILYDDSQVG